MSVPKFQNFMLPILKIFKDKNEHTTNECIEEVINIFNLNEEDTKLLVPSGKQTVVVNRVYWALTYLKKSMLLNTVKRGTYIITERGIELLESKPSKIDKKLLSRYEEYRKFSNQHKEDKKVSVSNNDENEEITPEENIDFLYKKINEQLTDDILEIISEKDPYYFERLVIDVLTEMGYGDINDAKDFVTKKSGDEGIDGIINQDKLGLDKIYIQAKRWKDSVGRPELQKFVGALSAKKSNKGIFITTSDFTSGAIEYVKALNQTIILIDGKKLANLMIEYNVGVQNKYVYKIKKLDNDYFEMI